MLVHRLAPFPTGDPGAYALVGMGTLFAGIVRAPMTSVFMIFEITQDYQILVPLMVANLLSFTISKHYQPAPVYHALLRQDGIHLPSPSTEEATSVKTARDVMTADLPLMPPQLSLDEARTWAGQHGGRRYLVGTPDRLEGIVSRQQLDDGCAAGRSAEPVTSLTVEPFVHAHPDHALDVVIDRLSQSGGLLPVVSRAAIRRLEGVVTPESLLAFGGTAGATPRSDVRTR